VNWKEQFDKQFDHRGKRYSLNKPNAELVIAPVPEIKAFISTQLEKLIDEIPDELPFDMPVGLKGIKQQLRDKWL